MLRFAGVYDHARSISQSDSSIFPKLVIMLVIHRPYI